MYSTNSEVQRNVFRCPLTIQHQKMSSLPRYKTEKTANPGTGKTRARKKCGIKFWYEK